MREFFGDVAVVHDKCGSNAALLAVFFVVINLDDLHATSVGSRSPPTFPATLDLRRLGLRCV